MATIAARKPFIKTKTATSIYYDIDSYPAENPSDITTYTVAKSSFDSETAEPLSIDLSVFAFPRFRSEPQVTLPTGISTPSEGTEIGLEVRSVDPTEYYNCYYGWVDFPQDTLGVTVSKRNLVLGSNQYVTANLFSTANIEWRTDTGKIISVPNPNVGLDKASVFPVILPALGLDETDSTLYIVGRNGSDDPLWTLEYTLQCAWDDAVTIGFINQFGVWEFFDAIGRTVDNTEFSRESYRSVLTGGRRTLNATAREGLVFNSGIVEESFYDIAQSMLLSESIVVYTGGVGSYYIEPQTSNLTKQTSRFNQIINYTLQFKKSTNIIPVV